MRSLIIGCAFLLVGSMGALAQSAPTNEGAGGTPTPGPAQDTPAVQEPAQAGGTPGSAMGTAKGTAAMGGTMAASHGKRHHHHASKAHHHKKAKSSTM